MEDIAKLPQVIKLNYIWECDWKFQMENSCKVKEYLAKVENRFAPKECFSSDIKIIRSILTGRLECYIFANGQILPRYRYAQNISFGFYTNFQNNVIFIFQTSIRPISTSISKHQTMLSNGFSC